MPRNKRCITLDLKTPEGVDTLLRLVDEAHVLIENFRPGTMERLGLGADLLHARNPRLVITRVSGFGQDGPYANRPGFATIAEAMSGFAAINGEPDGPPLLPPIALTDEVTAWSAAFATMTACGRRRARSSTSTCSSRCSRSWAPGRRLRTTGSRQPRLGPASPTRCRRNLALRRRPVGGDQHLVRAGRPPGDGASSAWATAPTSRRSTAASPPEEVDARMAEWCGARASPPDVLAAFEGRGRRRAGARHGRHRRRPHYAARVSIAEVGGVAMRGPFVARLSATPGQLRWPGRPSASTIPGLADRRAI